MSNPIITNVRPSAKEIAQIEKAIAKDRDRFLKYYKEIEDHKMVISHKRICMKPPSVPQSIWSTGVTYNQHSTFMRLPSEIMRNIWRMLEHPADRMALALSCKSHAALHSAFAQANTWNDIGKNMDKKTRLAVLIRMRPVVAVTYRLCFKCAKYRPRELSDWEGPTEEDSMRLVVSKMNSHGSRCMHCSRRERYRMLEHKQVFQQYKELLMRYSG